MPAIVDGAGTDAKHVAIHVGHSQTVPAGRPQNVTQGNNSTSMEAHVGLRGLLSLYITVYHIILFTTGWDIQGSAVMTFWFLLSGFSLSITYGREELAILPFCQESCPPASMAAYTKIDAWTFYRNRFARVMPVYYFANLLSIPLVMAGWSSVPNDMPDIAVALARVIPGVQTWVMFNDNLGFTVPAWTVSTMLFYYWIFPALFPRLQNFFNKSPITTTLWVCYLFQIIIPVLTAATVGAWSGDDFEPSWSGHISMPLFMVATMQPITRFPVFVMGCLGALGHTRFQEAPHSVNLTVTVNLSLSLTLSLTLTLSLILTLTLALSSLSRTLDPNPKTPKQTQTTPKPNHRKILA